MSQLTFAEAESDPGMEDALYEIESMRLFAGLRLSEQLPDDSRKSIGT